MIIETICHEIISVHFNRIQRKINVLKFYTLSEYRSMWKRKIVNLF